jgi:hypothetical protein
VPPVSLNRSDIPVLSRRRSIHGDKPALRPVNTYLTTRVVVQTQESMR